MRRKKISIVILAFYSKDYIQNCVEAIKKNTHNKYEIILVNNACPQESYKLVQRKADKFINNPTNMGFGFACNQGVNAASNEFVVLLNADTLVQPDWDIPLLKALEDSKVGIAVPKYTNKDNTVQEAGGLVGFRGETFFFGKGYTLDHPEVSFDRNVLYSSAAACMLRKNEFLELGGFSQEYKIAYFEDTDLMFRYYKMGFKIEYCSTSIVEHVTSTVSKEPNMSALIENVSGYNGLVFQDKWAEELSSMPDIANADILPSVVYAARDGLSNHNILIYIEDYSKKTIKRVEELSKKLSTFDPLARLTVLSTTPLDLDNKIENIIIDDIPKFFKDRLGVFNLIVIDENLLNKELHDLLHYYQTASLIAVLKASDSLRDLSDKTTNDFKSIYSKNIELLLTDAESKVSVPQKNIYDVDFIWESIPDNFIDLLKPYGWVN